MSIAERNRLMNGTAPKNVESNPEPTLTKKQTLNDGELYKNLGFGSLRVEEAKAEGGYKPL